MWPFDAIFDPFAGFYDIAIFGILLLCGILAFYFLPGRLFRFLVAGGLIIAAFAVLLGYWEVA